MRRKLKIFATITSLLTCLVLFQNCGEGIGNSVNFEDQNHDANTGFALSSISGTENLVISQKGTLGVARPGFVKEAYIEDGELKILFYKGLRKRDRQGFSRVNYYYDKWHFEFNNQYFAWTSDCGSTKTPNCLASFPLDSISQLNDKTGVISVVTYDTDGNYSESQDGDIEVTIAEEPEELITNPVIEAVEVEDAEETTPTEAVNSEDSIVEVDEDERLGVAHPGFVKNAYIENGKLKIHFYKGLRKRDRQGFSRVNYYYDKWHFEFNNKYFTWTSDCGSTKTPDCTASFSLDTVNDLRGRTGLISVTTYDTEGNYSQSLDKGVEVTIPLASSVVSNESPVNLPGAAGYMYTDDSFSMVLKNMDDSGKICRVAKPDGKVWFGGLFTSIFKELKAIAEKQENGIQDCE